jgi:predicted GIY-YIG superfamily endonuclease
VPKLKRIVYILKSERRPLRYYVGLTSDLRARLADHNAGRCRHTASGRPWRIDVIVAFTDQQRAVAFEQYLKSGSGSAFARRHLRSPSAAMNTNVEIAPGR